MRTILAIAAVTANLGTILFGVMLLTDAPLGYGWRVPAGIILVASPLLALVLANSRESPTNGRRTKEPGLISIYFRRLKAEQLARLRDLEAKQTPKD